jgi:hypothetical protein
LTNSTTEAKSQLLRFGEILGQKDSRGYPTEGSWEANHLTMAFGLLVLIEERISEKIVPAAGSTLTPSERGFPWNDVIS